uniref:Coat protein n=1 Tax=Ackermannviridae sp. ctQad106 TaxID=2826820 RepID=A0A8S5QNH0_9CAUD|nr:MAG TPA: coat protein [Ackermannviridae sp. ctQad106]
MKSHISPRRLCSYWAPGCWRCGGSEEDKA